jgi:hypothetical protein
VRDCRNVVTVPTRVLTKCRIINYYIPTRAMKGTRDAETQLKDPIKFLLLKLIRTCARCTSTAFPFATLHVAGILSETILTAF